MRGRDRSGGESGGGQGKRKEGRKTADPYRLRTDLSSRRRGTATGIRLFSTSLFCAGGTFRLSLFCLLLSALLSVALFPFNQICVSRPSASFDVGASPSDPQREPDPSVRPRFYSCQSFRGRCHLPAIALGKLDAPSSGDLPAGSVLLLFVVPPRPNRPRRSRPN